MTDTSTEVAPRTPSPESSVPDRHTDGDVDLTKNTKERLAYYESLDDRP